MMIKKLFTMTLVSLVTLTSCAKNSNDATAEVEQDGGTQGVTVYFTKDISAASLVKIYEALGVETSGSIMNSNQDSFLESMAAAAQAVHNYFRQEGKNIIYINVMNNLSVDCDCDGSPASPQMNDIGILASLDPVALDKACLDLVFNHISTSGDNADPLIQRINRQHGTHTVEYAEQIGLGTQSYSLVDLDSQTGIDDARTTQSERYNVYSLDGKKLLTNAANLDGLTKGTYIINGEKRVLE